MVYADAPIESGGHVDPYIGLSKADKAFAQDITRLLMDPKSLFANNNLPVPTGLPAYSQADAEQIAIRIATTGTASFISSSEEQLFKLAKASLSQTYDVNFVNQNFVIQSHLQKKEIMPESQSFSLKEIPLEPVKQPEPVQQPENKPKDIMPESQTFTLRQPKPVDIKERIVGLKKKDKKLFIELGSDLSGTTVPSIKSIIDGGDFFSAALTGADNVNFFLRLLPSHGIESDGGGREAIKEYYNSIKADPNAHLDDYDNWPQGLINFMDRVKENAMQSYPGHFFDEKDPAAQDFLLKYNADKENHLILLIDDDHAMDANKFDRGDMLPQNERDLSVPSLLERAKALNVRVHVVLKARHMNTWSGGIPEAVVQDIQKLREFCLNTGGTFIDETITLKFSSEPTLAAFQTMLDSHPLQLPNGTSLVLNAEEKRQISKLRENGILEIVRNGNYAFLVEMKDNHLNIYSYFEKKDIKDGVKNFVTNILDAIDGPAKALAEVKSELGAAPKLEFLEKTDDYFKNKKYSSSVPSTNVAFSPFMNSLFKDFTAVWSGLFTSSEWSSSIIDHQSENRILVETAEQNLRAIIACSKKNLELLKPKDGKKLSDIEALYIIHRTIFTQLGAKNGYVDNVINGLNTMTFDCKGSVVEYAVAQALGYDVKMKVIWGHEKDQHMLVAASDADGKTNYLESTLEKDNIFMDENYLMSLAHKGAKMARTLTGASGEPQMSNSLSDLSEAQIRSIESLKHSFWLIDAMGQYESDGKNAAMNSATARACQRALAISPDNVMAYLTLKDYAGAIKAAMSRGRQEYADIISANYGMKSNPAP